MNCHRRDRLTPAIEDEDGPQDSHQREYADQSRLPLPRWREIFINGSYWRIVSHNKRRGFNLSQTPGPTLYARTKLGERIGVKSIGNTLKG